MSDQTMTEWCKKDSHQCTLCGKQYPSKGNLYKHITYFHETKGRVTCKICKKQFSELRILQRHELYLHGEESISIKCLICRQLMYRGKLDTDPNCQSCAMERQAMASRGESVLNKLIRKPVPKLNLQCTICEKQFGGKASMKAHLLTVHVGRRVKCTICKMLFSKFRSLQRHQLNIHGKDSVSIKCRACMKLMFRGKSDTDPECQQCVMKRSALQYSDEKSQFIQKLKKSPKVCEICGLATVHIAEHQRIHKDTFSYECKLCGKGFKQEVGLNQHMKYHSDERPHACDLCDSKFKLRHHLQYHKRCIHSDERPHVCDICNKGFKLRQQLGYHKKIHGEK